LPDLEVSGGDHTSGAGVQFGIAERLASPSGRNGARRVKSPV